MQATRLDYRRSFLNFGLVFTASIALFTAKGLASQPITHTVDGLFGPGEWTVSPTDGTAARPTVSAHTFTVAGQTGGSTLYAEQATNGVPTPGTFGTDLFLMYDFTNSPNAVGTGAAASSFDVFFQVPSAGDDYAIHITQSGFTAFEKSDSTPSGENADGTLHITDGVGTAVSPWTALTSPDPDFALANFHGAVTFGPSPNSATAHLQAEFSVSIDSRSSPAGGKDGLYSPEPAFWSASGKGTQGDPPISSAIFTLSDDGTIGLLPQLGPNGGPVAQPSDVPEPGIALLLGTGLMAMVLRRRA
ncbi:MAG TPA: PEP-CTERM sorting domain-containing protein [Tepidisphaeraceae bacterium]|nr:PEP-CTERM sorting domain-containing protein [Tepidisphaeraceae bacterium]